MRPGPRALIASFAFALACASELPAPEPARGGGEAAGPVSFVDDDYSGARAAAEKEEKLLFVDAWAPWCHTCLSMRDEVLHRPELGAFSPRFVFAAVDTDRAQAAEFLERYRVRVWPTFFVIEPKTGAVLAMHGGAASLDEIRALLEAGERARRGGADPGGEELARAHSAYAKKELAEAARLYEDAATKLPDARRTEALVAAIRTHWEAGEHVACVEFGQAHAEKIRGSAAPSDFVLYMKSCAAELGDEAARDEALGFVKGRLDALVKAPPKGASVDDRSDTMGALAELVRASDPGRARSLEEERLVMLEKAAKAASRPEEAQTFDYARMNAYLALGRGDEAVAMFEERVKQLPESYEAHARLGSTLLKLGRHAAAAKALARAVELSYGPRRLRYMAQKAKAEEAAGDAEAAVSTLEQEVRGWSELPAAQRDPKASADAEARLAKARALTVVGAER